MTNEQIIADIAKSIYGEDVVAAMIDSGQDIPLHTFKHWMDRGFRVRKGEHGIEARLWKQRKKKGCSIDEEKDMDPVEGDFYLTKAFLFRSDQVKPVDR